MNITHNTVDECIDRLKDHIELSDSDVGISKEGQEDDIFRKLCSCKIVAQQLLNHWHNEYHYSQHGFMNLIPYNMDFAEIYNSYNLTDDDDIETVLQAAIKRCTILSKMLSSIEESKSKGQVTMPTSEDCGAAFVVQGRPDKNVPSDYTMPNKVELSSLDASKCRYCAEPIKDLYCSSCCTSYKDSKNNKRLTYPFRSDEMAERMRGAASFVSDVLREDQRPQSWSETAQCSELCKERNGDAFPVGSDDRHCHYCDNKLGPYCEHCDMCQT